MVRAEILRQVDPITGRACVTAEQLADSLDLAVGTVRKATSTLIDQGHLRKVKAGRNVEYLPGDREPK